MNTHNVKTVKKEKKKKKESVIHMETNILGNYIVWYLGQ